MKLKILNVGQERDLASTIKELMIDMILII